MEDERGWQNGQNQISVSRQVKQKRLEMKKKNYMTYT